MSDRRLSPSDAVWLYSEWDKNPQTVSSLMWMDREIDPDALRELLQTRLVDKFPTYHQRIRRSRNPLLMPYWEDDPEFSLDNHIEVVQLPAPGDKAALEKLVSEQRSTQLDFERPLWKFFLIQGYEGRSALHSRTQHCIADGWALVRLALSLADEAYEAPTVAEKAPKRKRETALKAAQPAVDALDAVTGGVKKAAGGVAEAATRAAGAVAGMAKEPATVPATLAGGPEALSETLSIGIDPSRLFEFGSQVPAEVAGRWGRVTGTAGDVAQGAQDAVDFVVAPRPGKTILHGKVSGTKKISWIEPIPLAPVRNAGRAFNATINDVLLACLTNALRKYLLEKDALTVEELSTAVPVSLRRPDEPLPRNLGNKFGLVPVQLPVGIADPVEQVSSLKAQLDGIKQSQMPIVSFGLMSVSALATPEVERLLHKITQDQSIGVTTNVPGPRTPLRLAGAEVIGSWGMGGLSGNMNLSFGIFSLNGQLNFAVHSDVAITPDPERILDHFLESVAELQQAAGVTE